MGCTTCGKTVAKAASLSEKPLSDIVKITTSDGKTKKVKKSDIQVIGSKRFVRSK